MTYRLMVAYSHAWDDCAMNKSFEFEGAVIKVIGDLDGSGTWMADLKEALRDFDKEFKTEEEAWAAAAQVEALAYKWGFKVEVSVVEPEEED